MVRLTLLAFAIIPSIALYAPVQAQECPVKTPIMGDLNPSVLKTFLNTHKNKITKPEDLVCCIAQNAGQKLEIAVSHSSIAAQNGDYNNPRVLIMSRDKKGKLSGIFSINSGATHLEQKDAVEFMFNGVNELQLFDIDFSKNQPHFSGKNPEACMNCHRTPTSPKPIFEKFPWRSFAENSTATLSGSQNCPKQSELVGALQTKAMQALKKNPRYACVKDLPRTDVAVLDEMVLNDLNNRRLVPEIMRTRDYSKFKFAIIGSQICDFDSSQWFPPAVLNTMNQVAVLPAELRNISSPTDLAKYSNERSRKLVARAIAGEAKAEAALQKIKNNQPVHRDVLDFESACSVSTNPVGERFLLEALQKISNPVQRQYAVMEEGRSEHRFLFESRGISTAHWGMEATDGYERDNMNIWVQLVQKESKNSSLYKLLGAIANRVDNDVHFNKHLEANEMQPVCENLRKWSLGAFGKNSPGAPSKDSNEVDSENPAIHQ